MDEEPAPFTCVESIIVEGGHLKKPWACQVTKLSGHNFLVLKKSDKDLCRALGYGAKAGMSGMNAFEYIALARNKRVDEIIQAKCTDPMADDDGDSKICSKDRSKLFVRAEVPNVIQVELAAFITASGKRIAAHTSNTISTPSKVPSVSVECTPSFLDWLVHACSMDWTAEAPDMFKEPPQSNKRSLPQDLPELRLPLAYTTQGKIAVYVCYKNENGVHTRKKKTIEDLLGPNTVMNTAIVHNVATTLMAFHTKNHHGTFGEDVEEGEAEELNDE